jgi:hypothetical protein
MAFQITNTNRGTSTITGCDAGSVTVTLDQLSTNTQAENVTSADIKRIMWSTSGSITVVRDGFSVLSLHTSGVMNFDEYSTAMRSNNTSSLVITIVTGGSFVMEVAKQASYNVDPFRSFAVTSDLILASAFMVLESL